MYPEFLMKKKVIIAKRNRRLCEKKKKKKYSVEKVFQYFMSFVILSALPLNPLKTHFAWVLRWKVS